MKSKGALLIGIGVLLIFMIIVFAMTIAVFVQLKDANDSRPSVKNPDGGGGGGTTGAPPATTSAGAATTAPPQTSAAPPLDNLNWYTSQFSDENKPWNNDFANPGKQAFTTTKSQYESTIKNALQSYNASAYENDKSQIIVNSFSGHYFNATTPITRIDFMVGVKDKLSSPQILENDLEGAAAQSGNAWRNIAADNPGLPPLPQADTTPGWVEAARTFKESINMSVDPCQDFFHFACDNYIATHPLDASGRQSTFDVLAAAVNNNLTQAFEKFSGDTPRSLKIIKRVYTACKNAKIDSYKGAKIITDIAQEYGGWPLLMPDWDPTKLPRDIYWIMGDMMVKHGVPTLIVPQVDIDFKNVTGRHMLLLDQANLMIPAEYYRSPNLTEEYQQRFTKLIYDTAQQIANQIGLHLNDEVINPQIARMVKLELDLANIMISANDQRNMSLLYNPYQVSGAKSEYPEIAWDSYFEALLKAVFTDYSDVLNPFIINQKNYMSALNKMLADFNKDANKKKDLVNYLVFRAINPYMVFAGPEMHSLDKEFKRALRTDSNWNSGTLEFEYNDEDERAHMCADQLVQFLPWSTGRLYVDGYFEPPNRDDVSIMINNVLSAFSSSLSGLRWMDNPSALSAFKKVQGLLRNVAYPDFQQNNTQLDQFYQSFNDAAETISVDGPQALFDYIKQIVLFNQKSNLLQLRQNGDRDAFLMSPAVVNAWYQPERNSITFPAAILNQPFYRYDFPFAVNYGALGVVMGHELSHGFDDQGIQFDYDGTLHTWMTPHAEEGFDKMAQCVVDEYSKFCYPGIACINGIRTQGENIGDNGGLKAAYRAYKAYTNSHGEEPRLPGLESFTMDQIFFMSYGQVWCGSYSDEVLRKQLLTNEHSPGKDRVLGAVRNFPKFGEAFNCKLGDPMYPYPADACDVW